MDAARVGCSGRVVGVVGRFAKNADPSVYGCVAVANGNGEAKFASPTRRIRFGAGRSETAVAAAVVDARAPKRLSASPVLDIESSVVGGAVLAGVGVGVSARCFSVA